MSIAVELPPELLAATEQLALEVQTTAAARAVRSRQGLRAQVQLPPLYPLQERIKREAARFNVLCIGRRAGKTYLSARLILETALDGQPAGWFVPDYKVALEVWRDIVRPLRQVATKINATERRIELPNGGVIEVWTLENEDAGIGRKYKRVVIDEAAKAPRLKHAWENAIRPTLTDLKGDAWFPSTPAGLNYYYDLFRRGVDPAQPAWKAWQLPSSVNPFLDAGEIEAARGELPELAFRQEFLAEFLQNEGAVFRNLEACLTAAATEPEAHAGHWLVAGLDWGRQHDFTAHSLYCCHCRREVRLDRFNRIGWDFQRRRVLADWERWGVREAVVETNSIGSPNLEALRQAAPASVSLRGFEMTAQSKPPLIQSLALSFEREQSLWLADETARHELVAYEASLTALGHTKYSAPEGGFDDTVIARALAWKVARQYDVPPQTEWERVEDRLAPGWRLSQAPPPGDWRYDGWVMARELEVARVQRELKKAECNLDDRSAPVSPLINRAEWRFEEQ